MRLRKKLCVALCALVAALLCLPCSAAIAETTNVGGGTHTVTFDFSDKWDFDFYAEFDQPMYIQQNRLYAPVLAESKAIYRGGEYSDVVVEVDITTFNKKGRINAGIYLQASGAQNAMDGITAWNVHVEREVGGGTYTINLFRFENGKYMGKKNTAEYLHYTSDTVHLKVVVKSGTLYAYADGYGKVFDHYIGTSSGKVGLRDFYSPVYFENFSVTAPEIAVDTKALSAELNELNNFDYTPYTEQTADALRNAIAQATEVCASATYQADIDAAYSRLVAAQNALLRKATREELDYLVARANTIIDSDEYTKNTVSSLRVMLAQMGETDGIDDEQIAYWCGLLSHKIECAVKYSVKIGGGNE